MNVQNHEHLEDDVLLRAIDGAEPTAAQLTDCDHCVERMERLRGRSTRLRHLLQATDAPERRLPAANARTRRRRFALSPANGVAALLAGALIAAVAVPPVRALLIDGLRRVLPQPPSEATEPRPDAFDRAVERDSSAIVSFPVTGPTVRLTVEHHQHAGAIVIVRGADNLVSASIMESVGLESLVVRSDGLRIVNAPNSTTGYRITLPPTIQDVMIALPNRSTRHLTAPTSDSLIVNLGNQG